MTTPTPSSSGADLRGFLEAAGRSLSEAQDTLTAGAIAQPSAQPSAMAISDAELEIKAAVSQNATGQLALQTLSIQHLQSGTIAPGLVSTVKIRYVAVPGEPAPGGTTSPALPKRNPVEVEKEVRLRPDLARIEKVLGGLKVEPLFVPERQRWLVTARDSAGRTVRELVLPDETQGGPDA